MKWQPIFPVPGKDGLAVWGNAVLYGSMLRWIREEWQMAGMRTRTFIILGALALASAFVGMIVVLRNWQAVPEITGESTGILTVEEEQKSEKWKRLASRTAAEQSILHEYFEAMGGIEKLASMKSVRATGELTFPDGRILRAVVVKREGGLIRFILGIAPRQVVMGVNPEDAWQSSWVKGKQVVEDLDSSQVVNMRRSGYPVTKLFTAMYNEWKVTYLGEKAFNYKMAHVFEVSIDEYETARFFIDPVTYLEVGTEEWVIDSEGVIITRHLQSEHFESDGLTMPGIVETHINGEYSHTYVVRKVEVNPGVLTTSFYRPELESAGAPTR